MKQNRAPVVLFFLLKMTKIYEFFIKSNSHPHMDRFRTKSVVPNRTNFDVKLSLVGKF